MSDNNPFGYDSLKLRAIFIPEDNPENITAADITDHLGHGSLRLRAVLIPDGNPDNISAADITDWLGHDVVRVGYSWSDSGEGQPEQEQEPPAEGPDGGGGAAGPIQGADGPDVAPTGRRATSAMPPTPTLAQAARYVDPAKTAVATWRATNALSPPSQPAVSRGGDAQAGTVVRPEAGSADTPGSSQLDTYIGNADPSTQLVPTSATPATTSPTMSTPGLSQVASSNPGLGLAAPSQSGSGSEGATRLVAHTRVTVAHTDDESDA